MKRNNFNSERMNVLFVISFDMLYPALCCYKLKLSSYELSGVVTINDRVDREGAKKKSETCRLQLILSYLDAVSCVPPASPTAMTQKIIRKVTSFRLF